MNKQDELYDFRAPNGVPSRCRARVYQKGERSVLVITELESGHGANQNPGMSVTNAIDELAPLILEDLGLPAGTPVIEHYSPASVDDPDREHTFDEVTLPSSSRPDPSWRRMDPEEVIERVGREAFETITAENVKQQRRGPVL